jgi:DNA-binding CsgD family transcriptional regulator
MYSRTNGKTPEPQPWSESSGRGGRAVRRHPRLSVRETGVLQLAASGFHRKETAYRLGCSLGPVDTYWRRLLRKTGCQDQWRLYADLLLFAIGQAAFLGSASAPDRVSGHARRTDAVESPTT